MPTSGGPYCSSVKLTRQTSVDSRRRAAMRAESHITHALAGPDRLTPTRHSVGNGSGTFGAVLPGLLRVESHAVPGAAARHQLACGVKVLARGERWRTHELRAGAGR